MSTKSSNPAVETDEDAAEVARHLDFLIANARDAAKATARRAKFLREHRDKLIALRLQPSFWNTSLEFDKLSHEKVVKVIKAFPGKWKKSPGVIPATIDYVLELNSGFRIRCWAGEPPPSCRIVEEQVHVPEHVVPAHTEIRKKLVCDAKEVLS